MLVNSVCERMCGPHVGPADQLKIIKSCLTINIFTYRPVFNIHSEYWACLSVHLNFNYITSSILMLKI